jgi:hypothetical protein
MFCIAMKAAGLVVLIARMMSAAVGSGPRFLMVVRLIGAGIGRDIQIHMGTGPLQRQPPRRMCKRAPTDVD